MEWEVGVSTCKLLYIEWINDKVLVYNTGNYMQYPVIMEKDIKKNGASQMALVVKNLSAGAGDERDMGSIPVSGRSPGGSRGNSLQCSCLGNPMDEEGAWGLSVHGVAEEDTTERLHFHLSGPQ